MNSGKPETDILRRLSRIEEQLDAIATSRGWSIIGYALGFIITLQVLILVAIAGS